MPPPPSPSPPPPPPPLPFADIAAQHAALPPVCFFYLICGFERS